MKHSPQPQSCQPVTCRTCRFCKRGYCTVRATIVGDPDKPRICRAHKEKQR